MTMLRVCTAIAVLLVAHVRLKPRHRRIALSVRDGRDSMRPKTFVHNAFAGLAANRRATNLKLAAFVVIVKKNRAGQIGAHRQIAAAVGCARRQRLRPRASRTGRDR